MGRCFIDAEVQAADVRYWPFKVLGKVTKPITQVECKGEARTCTPEEISPITLISVLLSIMLSALLRFISMIVSMFVSVSLVFVVNK